MFFNSVRKRENFGVTQLWCFSTWKEPTRQELFAWTCSDSMRGNGFTLKERTLRLFLGKTLLTLRLVRNWNRFPREVVSARSRKCWRPGRMGPKESSLLTGIPGGWSYIIFRTSFKPTHSMILWIVCVLLQGKMCLYLERIGLKQSCVRRTDFLFSSWLNNT